MGTTRRIVAFNRVTADGYFAAPDGNLRSPEMRALAVWMNEANSRLVHEFDPREIEALKKQPGQDIMIFGSGSIASPLTQHGLIDEYQFVLSPLLLGDGRTLIGGVPKSTRLDLLEAKAYPSGNVRLRYARRSRP